MLHVVDSDFGHAPLQRPQWMALLARAPLALLEHTVGEHASAHLQWLRRPEAGLMMVQARVGGTGERFNVGEVTVTRCALRLGAETTAMDARPGGAACMGVAWVLGRDRRQCTLAAVADALLQDPARHSALAQQLLQPVRQHLKTTQRTRAEQAQATRVDFFTVARETGAESNAEETA